MPVLESLQTPKTNLHDGSYSNFDLCTHQLLLIGRNVGKGPLMLLALVFQDYHPGLQCRRPWKKGDNAVRKPSPGIKHCHNL